MKTPFEFRNLFVFDLANNHQGDVAHASQIIERCGAVARTRGVRAALKFQFRDLDSFVHPAHRQGSKNKHIPRFLSTRLSREQFRQLRGAVAAAGMVTMSTPFDEASVALCEELDIEVVKIASCSATDWPLLECIVELNRPVVFSTGGLTAKQVDDLVSFFQHRRTHFAIMHCVSLYPTPPEHLQLSQIGFLKRRYPEVVIGFSTHESPDDFDPVQVAVAQGAEMLERHVGLPLEGQPLNTYSSTPEQLDGWIASALKARTMCGGPGRPAATAAEMAALQSLRRGVYARKAVKPGSALEREDVYFAMPCEEGQLASGDWHEGLTAREALARDEPLRVADLDLPSEPLKQALFTAIHTIKAMLNEAKIALPTEFETEFSHHYGLARFNEVGCTMVTCVNRTYCKKLVIQLPGQRHPAHYHKQKEETFQVLHGCLELIVEGRRRTLFPGDVQLVQQGVWHEFWSETGVIFEEISTTHVANDSFYQDRSINQLGAARKTLVNQWGRYQI